MFIYMVNRLVVLERPADPDIALRFVGVQRALDVQMLRHVRGHVGSRGAVDMERADLTAALDQGQDSPLVLDATAAPARATP
jgi:hypothetical protein